MKMKKQNFWVKLILTSLVSFSFNTALQAQSSSSCDTCANLATLNTYAQDTSTNTAEASGLLQTLLTRITLALFGALPALGNGSVAAAFSIAPTVENNAYTEQQTLLHSIETAYQGNSNDDGAFANNYSTIFGDYLLQTENSVASFDEKNASIAALYLDPSKATFYDDTQQIQAENYVKLASGVAVSHMRKPSSDWLTISSDHENRDKTNIRKKVSSYYTYSALQSAIADNFTYIYGLNKGKKITGTLEDYPESSISESGLFTYIATQKPENPDWYKQLAGMGIVGLLREQAILTGASFLMLSRIEEDLHRILITNSTQATIALIGTQALSDKLSSVPQP